MTWLGGRPKASRLWCMLEDSRSEASMLEASMSEASMLGCRPNARRPKARRPEASMQEASRPWSRLEASMHQSRLGIHYLVCQWQSCIPLFNTGGDMAVVWRHYMACVTSLSSFTEIASSVASIFGQIVMVQRWRTQMQTDLTDRKSSRIYWQI